MGGTARTYTYNGGGLLQSRTQGTPTSFLWDPTTSPSRLLQIGSDRVVYGLGPLYVVKTDTSTLAFARDGMKSVRAEVDGTGAVAASFRYAAYGELAAASPAGAVPTFLGYNGQLRDPSGLVYLRARWYDPATGRFLSRDPLRGDPSAPATLNAFGYAHANSTRYSDPSGMCPVCLLAAVWIGVELGLFGFDVIDAAQTVLDSEVSDTDRAIAIGGFGAGLVLPGGGYGTLARATRELGEAGLKLSIHAEHQLVNRAVNAADILSARAKGAAFTQPDGATVHLIETEADRFFYVITNQADEIVTVSGRRLPWSEIERASGKYGWQ